MRQEIRQYILNTLRNEKLDYESKIVELKKERLMWEESAIIHGGNYNSEINTCNYSSAHFERHLVLVNESINYLYNLTKGN